MSEIAIFRQLNTTPTGWAASDNFRLAGHLVQNCNARCRRGPSFVDGVVYTDGKMAPSLAWIQDCDFGRATKKIGGRRKKRRQAALKPKPGLSGLRCPTARARSNESVCRFGNNCNSGNDNASRLRCSFVVTQQSFGHDKYRWFCTLCSSLGPQRCSSTGGRVSIRRCRNQSLCPRPQLHHWKHRRR